MILATWNVNSIRARLERVTGWIAASAPDILCVQELKSDEEKFPRAEIEALGYHVAGAYQKTYNGVAIFSKRPIENIVIGLGDGNPDPQARLIAGTIDGVRVISAYVPNGQEVGSEKYAYKLAWMKRLRAYLDRECKRDAPVVLCGDFNVAPEPRDVQDPGAWENSTLFHPDVRAALAEVQAFGLLDAFRFHNDAAGLFSWWDYRMLGFPKNRGLRIDLILVTEALRARCTRTWIDREERKGKQASDHAPVLAEFVG